MKALSLTPLVTEKSLALTATKKYQFVVPVWATKNEVREQIASLFDVTVVAITTANYKSQAKRFKNHPGSTTRYKKVTVTVPQNQSIADFALPVEKDNADSKDKATAKTEKPEPVEAKTKSTITVRSRKNKGT